MKIDPHSNPRNSLEPSHSHATKYSEIATQHSKLSIGTGKTPEITSKQSSVYSLCEVSPTLPFGPRTVAPFIPVKSLLEVHPVPCIEDYEMGQVLGRGAYAVVKSAYHKPTQRRVALKIYEAAELQDPTRKKSVEREIAILRKLQHPNVIKLYEAIHTEDKLYLVLEYAGGSVLSSYIHRGLSEQEARRLFRMIMSGIEYCHSQEVCHRDIKLENILVDQFGVPKLIDFGFATCFPLERKCKMFCGTANYMAPEIVGRTEHLGPPADIWACGVLVYSMLTGGYPFKAAYDKEIYHRIQYGIYTIPTHLSQELRDLIACTMQVDPALRPTASALLDSRWFFISSYEDNARVATDSDIYTREQANCELRRVLNEEGNYCLIKKTHS